MDSIFLIGFMGAGKTTVGRKLAEKTGMRLLDFDEKIEEIAGCSISDYFAKYGEEAFRTLEHECLRDFVEEDCIVSTGGGIVLKEENRQLLKARPSVVYLQADPKVFYERLKEDQENVRPLIVSKTQEEVMDVYTPRIPLYEASSTFSIDTSVLTPDEVVEIILKEIKK